MEEQFILRLPDCLKTVDLKETSLRKISSREVELIHNTSTYPGIICRLPTILESQKNVDNKLYKISDISTLIVIYKDKDFDLNEEVARIENSGITPPMGYIRERKYKPNVVRTEIVEEIEKKVAELLREDMKAIKVDITTDETDSNDIDEFAAELENELPAPPQQQSYSFEDILTEKVTKPAFQIQIPKSPFQVQLASDEIKPIEPVKEEVVDPPELLEILAKIKEKEELLGKALNPILKKRFEQAISELKEEYKKKKNQ